MRTAVPRFRLAAQRPGEGAVGLRDSPSLHSSLRRAQGAGRVRPRFWRSVVPVSFLVLAAAVTALAAWIGSLGPVPTGQDLAYSTLVVDRDGRLLRPYPTVEGRW